MFESNVQRTKVSQQFLDLDLKRIDFERDEGHEKELDLYCSLLGDAKSKYEPTFQNHANILRDSKLGMLQCNENPQETS